MHFFDFTTVFVNCHLIKKGFIDFCKTLGFMLKIKQKMRFLIKGQMTNN